MDDRKIHHKDKFSQETGRKYQMEADKLMKAQKHVKMHIQWVNAQKGENKNEKADELAKTGQSKVEQNKT